MSFCEQFISDYATIENICLKGRKMSSVAAYDLPNLIPDEDERKSAKQLERILNSQFKEDKSIELPFALDKKQKGQVTLTPGLARSLLQHLEYVSSGKGIRIIPIESEFTTQQAADFLNVPREYLNKLLEEGEIEFEFRDRHRRIKIQNLREYKKKRDKIRSESMQRLSEI